MQPAKKRGRPFGAKSGKRAPPVNVNPSPYNPRPFLQIPVPTRRSEQLTKRPPPSSQNLPQDDNTKDELLAAPPLAQTHRSLIPPKHTVEDMEETKKEDESKEDDKERPQPPLTKRQKRAKEVIRRARPRNRCNGQSLGPDYFITRQPSVVSDLHVLGKPKIEENECPHCHMYQWPDECFTKANGDKYWHSCSNGRVSPILLSPEDNKASVERLPDGQEKQDLEKRQKAIEKLLHLLILNVEDMERVPEGPMNNKRCTKRSKEFQRLIVSYNNVLSFCNESVNVDHKNSA